MADRNNNHNVHSVYSRDKLDVYKRIHTIKRECNKEGMGKLKRKVKQSKGMGIELVLITMLITTLWILLTHTI